MTTTVTFNTPPANYLNYPHGFLEINTISAGASNVCNVKILAASSGGIVPDQPFPFEVWLSDSSAGIGVTGTTASGTVTAASGKGTVLHTRTAKKHLQVQSTTGGEFMLEITDTAKTGFYVCVQMPGGKVAVSRQLVTADYG